ncbi:transcription elongation factor GreB [beta proteobacterium KB13]|uniref:Transcription elongation factor GreB n=1 Tax=beta proteobacterium KB13 TaxID=314607 RepID=B6BUB7_9PROT|nr:transcription elongation factor GreB [beta proteobacterium KB13]
MSEQSSYLTKNGFIYLREELNHLLKVDRPRVVKDVSWAASNGDRSENGDYIYGKKRLRQIDSRVKYLLTVIEDSKIIDPLEQENKDKVFFGATVEYENLDKNQINKIQIVGVPEVDPKENKISWLSPLSKAILGKQVGEIVSYESPSGQKEIEIMSIIYR